MEQFVQLPHHKKRQKDIIVRKRDINNREQKIIAVFVSKLLGVNFRNDIRKFLIFFKANILSILF